MSPDIPAPENESFDEPAPAGKKLFWVLSAAGVLLAGFLFYLIPRIVNALPQNIERAGVSFHGDMPLQRLEKALPPNAYFAGGGRDLGKIWDSVGSSNFGRALENTFPNAATAGVAVSSGHWSAMLPADMAWALYDGTGGAGKPSIVFLAAFPPDGLLLARNFLREWDKSAAGRPDKPFAALSSGTLVFSNDAALGQDAFGRLGQDGLGNAWLTDAHRKIPAAAQFYSLIDIARMEAVLPVPKTAWSQQPFAWVASGLYFNEGLWAESWSQPKKNLPDGHFLFDPPRQPEFPSPAEGKSVLHFSICVDLEKLYLKIKENQEKTLKELFPAGTPKGKSSDKEKTAGMDFEKDLVPWLGNEAGLVINKPDEKSLLPDMAVFMALRYSWISRFFIGRGLAKSGWKKSGGLWINALGGKLLPLDLAADVKDGFFLIGTRPAVENLTAGFKTANESFASPLSILSPPRRITSLFCLDVKGAMEGISQPLLKLSPMQNGEKARAAYFRAAEILALIPPLTGYSVNTKEGNYARLYAPLHDRSRGDWERFLAFFKTSASRSTASRLDAPEMRIESQGDLTKITIHGTGAFRAKAASGPAPVLAVVPPDGDPMHAMLSDPDWMVRRDAIEALSGRNSIKDLPVLKIMLGDPQAEVRTAAQAAADKISKSQPPPAPKRKKKLPVKTTAERKKSGK